MSSEYEPGPPSKGVHVFMHPEVVELHLQRQEPLPAGTAKLLWLLNQLFKDDPGPLPS